MEKNYRPYYDKRKRCWRVDFPDRNSEEGDLLYVASEFIQSGLYYPYRNSATRACKYNEHDHTFEGVLMALLDDPKGFTIEGFEEYYSKQEIKMLWDVQKKLQEEIE